MNSPAERRLPALSCIRGSKAHVRDHACAKELGRCSEGGRIPRLASPRLLEPHPPVALPKGVRALENASCWPSRRGSHDPSRGLMLRVFAMDRDNVINLIKYATKGKDQAATHPEPALEAVSSSHRGGERGTPVGAGIVVRRTLGPEKLGRKGLATAPAPRQDYSIDMSALVDISALGKRNAASGHPASTASLKYQSGTMARVNMPDPSTESGPANTILYSH